MPSQSDLQSCIPAGRLAVAVKPFIPPTPAFGPGSLEYVRLQAEALELATDNDGEEQHLSPSTANQRSCGTYAGAGSYF